MSLKVYNYMGWQFAQLKRGYWGMVRDSDGFKSSHQTKGGCEAFIRLHGSAPNPDQSYQDSI